MKNEDPDPLTLSAARGSRLIALDRLDDAEAEADKLASDPKDLRALHDLRVALRRMRSWLRAFKPDLDDSVSGKDRHRLRDLVDATNLGRDADVQIAWLRKASREGDPMLERGAKQLVDLIKTEKRNAGAPFNGDSHQLFEKERSRLAKRLSTVTEPVREPREPPPTLAATIAARLPAHLQALQKTLESIRSADDEREAHAARIAAKRLRYLLEPAKSVRGCKSLLSQLKSLQDNLGDLHDTHVLGHRVSDAILNCAGPDAASLQAVARTLAADRAALFDRVDRDWLRDETSMENLSRGLDRLGRRLARLSRESYRR